MVILRLINTILILQRYDFFLIGYTFFTTIICFRTTGLSRISVSPFAEGGSL